METTVFISPMNAGIAGRQRLKAREITVCMVVPKTNNGKAMCNL